MSTILQINLCRPVYVYLLPYSNINTNNCRELDFSVYVSQYNCMLFGWHITYLRLSNWRELDLCESVSVSLCAQMKLVTAVLSFLLVYHKHKFPHPLWRVHIAMTEREMFTNKNVFISLMHTILCFSIFDLNKNADNYSIHLKIFEFWDLTYIILDELFQVRFWKWHKGKLTFI